MVATALPAAATWQRTTLGGSPGYVTNVSTPPVEGGVCGVPVPRETQCTDSRYDQIYVGWYRAYSAPYSYAQNIQSAAYLYYWDGSTWHYSRTASEGTCYNQVGNGSGWCRYGSPPPDQTNLGDGNNVPAFYPLTPGYSWTVVIRVWWYRSSDGALLAQADYRPNQSPTPADIACAYYAQYTVHQCTGPSNYAGATFITLK
jgi:hypothetical protein